MGVNSTSLVSRPCRSVRAALLCVTALAGGCAQDEGNTGPLPNPSAKGGGSALGHGGSGARGGSPSDGATQGGSLPIGGTGFGGSAGDGSTRGGSSSAGGSIGGSANGGSMNGAARGGAGVAAGTGGAPAVTYTLVVDAPKSAATIQGLVTVHGTASGFVNVEAWDATHQNPPLGRATPAADGTFSFSVDTSRLSTGKTEWSVWAWDTPAGVPPTRSASVPLSLTIATAGQGSGGTSSTGGSSGTGGRAPSGGAPANAGSSSSGGAIGTGGTTGSGGAIETVGSGSMDAPAIGPGPTDSMRVGGAPFTLVKNWNFGSNGTLRDIAELSTEFMYHDQFGTIGNGTNYGALTVAPNAQTAIQGQPVEDAARPYRDFTTNSMRAYVRPLSTSQSNVSVAAHNAGNGSITAKWTLASGGKLLGKDLLWETRARMPVAAAAYWFAIWTAGNKWDGGAEMDVLESFGTPNIYPPPAAFHVNSVGGRDTIDYSSWPNGLSAAGVPSAERDLRNWHIWSWLYRKDDTYVVYYDGHVVQSGSLVWTLGGSAGGEHIDMSFLFDFGWGHTKIADVNITLPAADFNITYEIDYSRVYLRQ